jgi:GNAT superfamily N-acetyltransferase
MSDYVLVPSLERATVADYVVLFAQSFAGDNKLNASYLGWQYESNPHGKVIGMDAFLGDELAAHYAIIPRRYRLGVQIFDAALSVNTATHPQHQGKGLFTKLAAATYELAAQRGVKFVVGAANANSVGGFTRKLGFTALGQIRLRSTQTG